MMSVQSVKPETLSIPESVDLGKILKSCQYSWPEYFVDALVHKVFPEYFHSRCKSWGAESDKKDTNAVVAHNFALGFREYSTVAEYSVIIRDSDGNRVSLGRYGSSVEHSFHKIKGITVDAIVRLAHNMEFGDGCVCSFYPVEFSDHPVLMNEKYFTALSYVLSSITLKEYLASTNISIFKLNKFKKVWKSPEKTCLELRLSIPKPTYERVHEAAKDFSRLHKYFADNAHRLATATLLAHTALTADESKKEIDSTCGEAPVSFTKNLEDLYCTANEFIKSIEAPHFSVLRD